MPSLSQRRRAAKAATWLDPRSCRPASNRLTVARPSQGDLPRSPSSSNRAARRLKVHRQRCQRAVAGYEMPAPQGPPSSPNARSARRKIPTIRTETRRKIRGSSRPEPFVAPRATKTGNDPNVTSAQSKPTTTQEDVLLPPGIRYDPNSHSPQSAPLEPEAPLDAESVSRRHAEDGTPYCACCPTALLPRHSRGRPSDVCSNCAPHRERARRARYEERRAPRRSRPAGSQPPKATDSEPAEPDTPAETTTAQGNAVQRPTHRNGRLSATALDELSDAIENLTKAVGRASANFRDQESGTWQHELLLAAKDLLRWKERHL